MSKSGATGTFLGQWGHLLIGRSHRTVHTHSYNSNSKNRLLCEEIIHCSLSNQLLFVFTDYATENWPSSVMTIIMMVFMGMTISPDWIREKTNMGIRLRDELSQARRLDAVIQQLEAGGLLTGQRSSPASCPSASPHHFVFPETCPTRRRRRWLMVPRKTKNHSSQGRNQRFTNNREIHLFLLPAS